MSTDFGNIYKETMIFFYNIAQACANVYMIGVCCLISDVSFVHRMSLIVELSQISDVLLSLTGVTRSNVITTSIQTFGKCTVVAFGTSEYIRYLALTWAISDCVRYSYHCFPKVCVLKWLRYSQYKLLYPIGISLEIATILPAVRDPYVRVGLMLLYAFFAPHMFNNTSIMETQQFILSVLNRGTTLDGEYKISYGKKTYYYNEGRYNQIRSQMTASRYNWKMDDKHATLKDYGIQISWRLVYLIEYFGAFVAFPMMAGFERVDTALWVAHYAKRLLESAFLHSFSSDTMPLLNVFKNSGYYWGAGLILGYYAKPVSVVLNTENSIIVGMWIVCQLGNGFCHYYLANLRSDRNSKEHVLPTNILFRLVTCPNYTFEILGWALFAILGYDGITPYFGVRIAFCMIGAIQMHQWAGGKKRRYKKLFGDKYKVTGVLLPGI